MESFKENSQNSAHASVVEPVHALMRLDHYIHAHLPLYSRSYMQKLIEKGCVYIDGKVAHKSSMSVKIGSYIQVNFPENNQPSSTLKSVDHLAVQLIFEHEHFLIINKPPHLNVHAPHTHYELPTLVDWLVARMPSLMKVGAHERPGIVHRLDKDTSGIMVIPKNNYAHAEFGRLFASRAIQKTYHALVAGRPLGEGIVRFAIGRHPTNPTKMSHFTYGHSHARAAQSNYKVLEYFDQHALVEVKPITGRTHQIRVHCAAIGHSVVGDTVYGASSYLIARQALHAHSLSFTFEGVPYSFSVEMPDDMRAVVVKLRA